MAQHLHQWPAQYAVKWKLLSRDGERPRFVTGKGKGCFGRKHGAPAFVKNMTSRVKCLVLALVMVGDKGAVQVKQGDSQKNDLEKCHQPARPRLAHCEAAGGWSGGSHEIV